MKLAVLQEGKTYDVTVKVTDILNKHVIIEKKDLVFDKRLENEVFFKDKDNADIIVFQEDIIDYTLKND